MRAVVAIFCVLWIVGIALGIFSVLLGLVGVLGVLCVLLLHKRQVFCAAIAVLVLGYIYGYAHASSAIRTCTPAMPSSATLTEIRGMYPTYTLSVFTRDDTCSILVYAPRGLVLFEGARVTIEGKAERSEDAFGALPGYVKFLYEDGIALVVRNPHITVHTQGISRVSQMRKDAMHVFERLFPEPDASVFIAMMIGDRGMIPRDITSSFQKSGIIHILSISGFHVSLIASVLLLVFWRLPFRSWLISLCIGVVLWAYIGAIGAPPAAIRAGMFWTLIMIAYRSRALIALPTTILLTLAALLTYDATLVRSIGFQLSIAAVSGIGVGIFLFRRIYVSRYLRPVVASFAVSLGASLATFPLTAYYFGNISIVGIIVNIIIVPLVALMMYLALVAVFVSMIIEPLGLALSFSTHILMRIVIETAHSAAIVPYGSFENIIFPAWAVGLYYVCFFIAFFVAMRILRIRFREIWI